jgi:hypothetical protein
MEAFRKKEYVRVCEVLDPIEVHLEPLQRQKLAYARKKKDK